MSSSELDEARSRFEIYSRGILDALIDLRVALADLAERSPQSVLVPQVTVERVAGSSSLDCALRFVAGVNEVLGQIEPIEDRHVVAARASLVRHVRGLCQALAEIERIVPRDRL